MKPNTRLTLALYCLCALLALTCVPLPAAAETAAPPQPTQTAAFAHPYGVFLSCDATQMERFAPYQTLVIDAEYFTAEDVAALKAKGHTVYTYLNLGSVENFRAYYSRFESITLAPYENWPGERWVDVSKPEWQAFITGTLSKDDLAKGVDGFFIDNCDVYYLYPTDAIFNGLVTVLKALRSTGAAVVINGGDTFVTAYADRFGSLSDVMTAVNQETVFSRIHFDSGTFGTATKEDHAYYTDYVQRAAALGCKVYLLEYTKNKKLIGQIAAYCEKQGFDYYVSDSIELD